LSKLDGKDKTYEIIKNTQF